MDEKVMDLLEKIRDAAGTANQTARVAGRKAGQMVDVAKLNVQLFDLNGEFNDTLRQLGQVMYDAHLGQTAEDSRVSTLLARADDTAGHIAELKERIADLRQTRSCPVCGFACGRDDKFCRRCGGGLD